jgi:hypothetical protein
MSIIVPASPPLLNAVAMVSWITEFSSTAVSFSWSLALVGEVNGGLYVFLIQSHFGIVLSNLATFS